MSLEPDAKQRGEGASLDMDSITIVTTLRRFVILLPPRHSRCYIYKQESSAILTPLLHFALTFLFLIHPSTNTPNSEVEECRSGDGT